MKMKKKKKKKEEEEEPLRFSRCLSFDEKEFEARNE